ncbi:hypothetical protein BCR32DRAFT_247261 [Anaeromyces robustus]|uniref:Uncharacterized protein n=1 Tax=Anaeromyces robustus TaxID=1754192 RepID=A0A1Y1WXM9_9FUNG|nr:hypothetical protein BCR32DRAFT_247261 [Anaeromyces robustus]|eukprot:ORX78300.1 hypothetical protein BCR32DRAFT_247261 [Anaeromyces robustus]
MYRKRYYRGKNVNRGGQLVKRARGNVRAAKKANDSTQFTVNFTYPFVLSGTTVLNYHAGVVPLNVWDLLSRAPNFQNFRAMYDQCRIDYVKVKLQVTNSTLQTNNASQTYDIYTAWDRTGVSYQDIYPHTNEGKIDGIYCIINDAIQNYSGVSKMQLNVFQKWRQNKNFELKTTDDLKLYLNSNNPGMFVENNKYPFKPTLLVGAFTTGINSQGKAVSNVPLTNNTKIVMTAEFSVGMTFRALKGTPAISDFIAKNRTLIEGLGLKQHIDDSFEYKELSEFVKYTRPYTNPFEQNYIVEKRTVFVVIGKTYMQNGGDLKPSTRYYSFYYFVNNTNTDRTLTINGSDYLTSDGEYIEYYYSHFDAVMITGTNEYYLDIGKYSSNDMVLFSEYLVPSSKLMQFREFIDARYYELSIYPDDKKPNPYPTNIELQEKDLSITSNTTTTVLPDINMDFDGLSKVTVVTNVQPNLESKSLTVTSNGTQTISASSGYDGLSSVDLTTNVQPNLQIGDVNFTVNGNKVITPSSGYDGIAKVNCTVNVQPNLESKSLTVTNNGTQTISPSSGYDGISSVNLTTNVQSTANLQTKNMSITHNGSMTIVPDTGYDGISSLQLGESVLPNLTNVSETYTANGTYTIRLETTEYDGIGSATVNVNVPQTGLNTILNNFAVRNNSLSINTESDLTKHTSTVNIIIPGNGGYVIVKPPVGAYTFYEIIYYVNVTNSTFQFQMSASTVAPLYVYSYNSEANNQLIIKNNSNESLFIVDNTNSPSGGTFKKSSVLISSNLFTIPLPTN